MTGDLQRWDIRVSKVDKDTQKVLDPGQIAETLDQWCSKWVFQLEEGKDGYLHYQGRINLTKAKTLDGCKKALEVGIPKIYVSPTSAEVYKKGTFQYAMKADTRIDGPWSDECGPKTMTKQLELFMEKTLYPWQEKIVQIAKQWDERKITVVLDKQGDAGKSMLTEWMEYHNVGYEIPCMTQMEDIMQACMCLPAQKCYMIDMPKGLKKEKLASFYAGLECLKNGVMYDKRYSFKKRRIDRPQIIVFTNCVPDYKLLSIDRWDMYRITDEKDLEQIPMDIPP